MLTLEQIQVIKTFAEERRKQIENEISGIKSDLKQLQPVNQEPQKEKEKKSMSYNFETEFLKRFKNYDQEQNSKLTDLKLLANKLQRLFDLANQYEISLPNPNNAHLETLQENMRYLLNEINDLAIKYNIQLPGGMKALEALGTHLTSSISAPALGNINEPPLPGHQKSKSVGGANPPPITRRSSNLSKAFGTWRLSGRASSSSGSSSTASASSPSTGSPPAPRKLPSPPLDQ